MNGLTNKLILFLILLPNLLLGQVIKVDSLKELLDQTTDEAIRMQLVIQMAQADPSQNDCINLLNAANNYIDKISNNQLLVKFYWQKGQCHLRHSQILEGLNYLLKAEELAKEDNRELPNILIDIAAVYDELEVFDETLERGKKAQKIAQKNQDYRTEMSSIFAIISGAFALRKFDVVKNTSQRALILINEKEIMNSAQGYIYYLLGKTALAENQIELAIEHFEKCLSMSVELKNKEEISYAYEGLSMAYFQKNDLKKATHFTELALEFTPSYISDRTFGFAQIFAENKNYQRAYELLQDDAILKAKRDSINNSSEIVSVLLTEKFDQEKSSLQLELDFQKELGFRNLLIVSFIASIVFLTFLYFYNKRKNEKQKLELKKQVKEQTHQILDQKEQLQKLNLAKSRLYTNITHEFRTPLTVISGIANQLEGNEDKKELINRNSHQLLNLVNQMLDLRKLESGSISIQKKQGDIIKFLRYLTESLKSYAEVKGITIHFISDEESLMMDFDSEKITRIHSNLLSNAIKFTPDGGNIYVQLAIGKKQDSQQLAANSLLLTVRDTGVGISKEKLPHIFERFYQVDNSTTRKGEGTGIGLTLVAELIKAMQCEIKVNSKVGRGTTFTIQLPITNEAEFENSLDWGKENFSKMVAVNAAIPNNLSFAIEEEAITSKPTVLIVEDNADVIHYLITCLKKTYNIEIAMNGEEGIEKALEEIPDLIVSDVMMPVKDGFELCQTLKTDERTSHIPIVLLTAKADMEARLQGLQRGADAYLSKPFHQEELVLILKNQLELRQRLQSRFLQISPQPISNIEAGSTELEPLEEYHEIEDAYLQKIRTLIETDLSNSEIGMPQLMRHLQMSRSQIYKKVKALTGRSPSQYIRSIRLHHAKELLEKGQLNVSEAAYEVGFNSPFYFSEVFFKEFGIRPNETRK